MANFHYGAPFHMNSHSPNSSSHHHHGGRSRRAPRLASAHTMHNKHYNRNARTLKEPPPVEPSILSTFRKEFEAARSFDLEDDELFCPFNLLTEDDLQFIHSPPSDRSSLSSGSPESSPLQPQVQPTPSVVLSSATNSFNPAPNFQPGQAQHHTMKIHQPSAQRIRNAIPIVDPSTRSNVSPSPPSISPARQMQQQYARRW